MAGPRPSRPPGGAGPVLGVVRAEDPGRRHEADSGRAKLAQARWGEKPPACLWLAVPTPREGSRGIPEGPVLLFRADSRLDEAVTRFWQEIRDRGARPSVDVTPQGGQGESSRCVRRGQVRLPRVGDLSGGPVSQPAHLPDPSQVPELHSAFLERPEGAPLLAHSPGRQSQEKTSRSRNGHQAVHRGSPAPYS